MEHIKAELDNLKHFRNICLTILGIAVGILMLLSAITFAPSAYSMAIRISIVTTIIGLYFLIIGFRAHIAVYQIAKSGSKTIGRPAPEWITVIAIICILVTIISSFIH